MDEIRRRIRRLREGQTVHCPHEDCGFGFPVTDEGTADVMEKLLAVYEAARQLKEHELMKNNPCFPHHQELRDALTAVQTKGVDR